MAFQFLLDTNILSDILRNPQGIAAQKARRHQNSLCTSIVVAAELRYGSQKKGSPELQSRIESLLRTIPVLSLDHPCDDSYGRIRVALEAKGQMIGGNDLWIAAHALALGLVLVTANLREFARVPDLSIVNWLTSIET